MGSIQLAELESSKQLLDRRGIKAIWGCVHDPQPQLPKVLLRLRAGMESGAIEQEAGVRAPIAELQVKLLDQRLHED